MCKFWSITKAPTIIINEMRSLDKEVGAYYDYTQNTIVLERSHNNDITLYRFFHEIRHAWQKDKYPNVFAWWTRRRKLYEYYYRYTSIELDAVDFGRKCVVQQCLWYQYECYQDLLQAEERYLCDQILVT